MSKDTSPVQKQETAAAEQTPEQKQALVEAERRVKQLETQQEQREAQIKAETDARDAQHKMELDKLKAELEEAKKEQKTAEKAKAEKPGKYDKGVMLRVTSNTDYSYVLENGDKVKPGEATNAVRKTGNVLDCQMNAGLIVEYEG